MKDFHCDSNDVRVSGVEGSLDRDDELRDNTQHLSSALLEDVKCALHCQEPVWVLLLPKPFKEYWKIMMKIEVCDVDLPSNPVTRARMLNDDREISSLVVSSEFRDGDYSSFERPSLGLRSLKLLLGLVLRESLSSVPCPLLEYIGASDRDTLGMHLKRLWFRVSTLLRHLLLGEVSKH